MKKRDATEADILRVLRQVGADYVLLDPFDILCLWRGQLHMMDCKTLIGRRTVRQQQLVDRGWPLHFVVTPQDALKVLGIGQR
jgi:hypothetical protein